MREAWETEEEQRGRARWASVSTVVSIVAIVVSVVATLMMVLLGGADDAPSPPSTSPGPPSSQLAPPSSLLIDTGSCLVGDIGVEVPDVVVVGEPFDVALDLRAGADGLVRTPCPAVVYVRPFGDSAIDVRGPGPVPDLWTADLRVPAVARATGEANIVVEVAAVEACTRPCGSPFEQVVEVIVEADPRLATARARVREILDGVEVRAQQDEPLVAGRSREVDVIVECASCGPTPDGGVTLRASSSEGDVLRVDVEEDIATPQVDAMVRTTGVATLTGDGEVEAPVVVTVEARVGNEVVTESKMVGVGLEGSSPSLFQRLATWTAAPGAVAASVAAVVAVLGGAYAAWVRAHSGVRRSRRRRRGISPVDDAPDQDEVEPEDGVL